MSLRDALHARRLTLPALVAELSAPTSAEAATSFADAPFDLGLHGAERQMLADCAVAPSYPDDWRGHVLDSILIPLLWNQHGGVLTAHGARPSRGEWLDAFESLLDELRDELDQHSDRTDFAERSVHELFARALFRIQRLAELVAATRELPVTSPPAPTPVPASAPDPEHDFGTHPVETAPRKATRELAATGATTRIVGYPPSHDHVVAPSSDARRRRRITLAALSTAAALVSIGYGISASRAYLNDPAPAKITSESVTPFFPGAKILPVTDGEKAERLVRIELSTDAAHAPAAEVRQRTFELCKFLASTRYERAVIVDRLSQPVATWIEGRLTFQGAFAERSAGSS